MPDERVIRHVMMSPKLIVALPLAVLTGCLAVRLSAKVQQDLDGGAQAAGFALVDSAGNIRKPAEYRDRYQLLGAYVVLDPTSMVPDAPKASGDEMHYTYASPGTAEFYRKNGRFADGAVLVKEVLATNHAPLTTGDAHWAEGTKVWFVMIKDEKNRFPDNPLWGDGWGWALFKSDAPDAQVATNYRKDCLGCHLPAKGTDWVYVQGYPVLGAQ